jgi:hypothetical protein
MLCVTEREKCTCISATGCKIRQYEPADARSMSLQPKSCKEVLVSRLQLQNATALNNADGRIVDVRK